MVRQAVRFPSELLGTLALARQPGPPARAVPATAQRGHREKGAAENSDQGQKTAESKMHGRRGDDHHDAPAILNFQAPKHASACHPQFVILPSWSRPENLPPSWYANFGNPHGRSADRLRG